LNERDAVQISVGIARDQETIQVAFRDHGPGYPEKVLRFEEYGAGLDLILKVVHKNLDGELSLHNDGGAVATLRFQARAE
jgi:two-component sensor histidine kinase